MTDENEEKRCDARNELDEIALLIKRDLQPLGQFHYLDEVIRNSILEELEKIKIWEDGTTDEYKARKIKLGAYVDGVIRLSEVKESEPKAQEV